MSRRCLVVACVAALCAVASPSWAHRGRATRKIMLEAADGQRLVVLVHLRITGDAQREALMVGADLNRDGRLQPHERRSLELNLAVRALDGLRLWVDTTTVSLEDVQSKLQLVPDGPVEVMVHGTAALPDTAKAVRLRTPNRGDPTDLSVARGHRKARVFRGGRPVGAGAAVPLSAGDEVVVRLGPPRPSVVD